VVKQTRWTAEEKQFVKDNYDKMEYIEIGTILDRSKDAVRKQVKALGLNKLEYWTEEEDKFLLKHYGKTAIESISKKLNRSILAIEHRIYILEGTANAHEYTGYLSTVDMSEITGLTRMATLNIVKKKELPSVKSGRGYLVSPDSFWKWVKNNTHRINAKKVPDYVLIVSPEWFQEAVRDLIRKENNKELKSKPLTDFEKTVAWNMFLKGCTIKEIATEIKRDYGAVQMMLYRKKVKLLNKKAS